MAKRKELASSLAATMSLQDVKAPTPDSVNSQDGRLLWRTGDAWEEGGPAVDALPAFARLAEADDDGAFVKFARRWGVLGLLQDGSPGVLSGELPPVDDPDKDASRKLHVEPIAGWRGYARHAKACLYITHALQTASDRIDAKRELVNAGFPGSSLAGRVGHGHPLTEDDRLVWGRFGRLSLPRLIGNLDQVGGRPDDSLTAGARAAFWERPPLDRQREWFGHHIAMTWLAFGRISPGIEWTGKGPRLSLSLHNWQLQLGTPSAWPPNPLVSILAAQIATSVMFGKLTPCDHCGLPFTAARDKTCPACRYQEDRERHRVYMAKKRASVRGSTTPKLLQNP